MEGTAAFKLDQPSFLHRVPHLVGTRWVWAVTDYVLVQAGRVKSGSDVHAMARMESRVRGVMNGPLIAR